MASARRGGETRQDAAAWPPPRYNVGTRTSPLPAMWIPAARVPRAPSCPPRRRLPDRPRRAAAAVASVSGSDAVTFVIEPMPKEREPRLDASFLDTLIIFK